MANNSSLNTKSPMDNIGFDKISKDKILNSGFENFKKPLWNNENSEYSRKVFNINHKSFRFAVEAIDSMKSQFKMMVKRHVVPETEGKHIIEALDKVFKELQSTKLSEIQSSLYEYIERRIQEIAPEAFGWLNVARSENAQKAGDSLYWTRSALSKVENELQKLQANLIEKAESSVKVVYPGRSHGQLTQPISFGHYLMAYVENFGRDRARMKHAKDNASYSPYMAGYMSGNSYNVSADMVAKHLEFSKAFNNTIDAVSSRDYAIETLSALANSAVNMSKLARDLHRWHSSEANYISFSSQYVEQHDASPFKRDQRFLEGVIASCSSISHYLSSAIAICSSIGQEPNSELEKISEYVVSAYDEYMAALKGLTALIADFTINTKAMKEAAYKNFSVALDLVDYIVQKSSCDLFKAQATTRSIIDYAVAKGKKLSLLELDEIQQFIPQADDTIYSVLIPSRAIITRRSFGGSNPVQVRKAIRIAKRKYLQ